MKMFSRNPEMQRTLSYAEAIHEAIEQEMICDQLSVLPSQGKKGSTTKDETND